MNKWIRKLEWLPAEDSQLQARAIEGEENTVLFNFVKWHIIKIRILIISNLVHPWSAPWRTRRIEVVVDEGRSRKTKDKEEANVEKTRCELV